MTSFAGQPGAGTGGTPPHARSGRLFRKYAAIFVGAVCLALVTNGAFDMWFSYQEQRALLVQISTRAGRIRRIEDQPIRG